MALASAKQLLDELMGRNRDLAPAEKGYNWDDAEVCKHFLVKFCPNELFINTKADLGPCSKIHDENMRREYAQSTHYMKSHYEDEFLRFCQGMLADVEKRIRRAKMRLQLGQKEAAMSTAAMAKENEEKCQELTAKINALLIQVEQLGCEGNVEEAQALMRHCDQLKEQRYALQRSESSNWLQENNWTAEIAAAQEKQMEVCGVCGAFLIVGDAQQRVDDHLMGKQHVGYARLKSAVDEIVHKREKEREQREKEREERRKWLEREEERRRESYHRSDDHRKRDSRRTHRSRSRSRSRDRRSRSHNRKHRSRSRDRSCHRRHSSHRSRDRSSHSRTRERGRYRSRSRSSDAKHSRGHSRDKDYRKRSRSRSSEHSSSDKKRNSKDYDKKKHSDSPENEENSPKVADVDYRVKQENSKGETEENDAENTPKVIDTDYRIKPQEVSKHETEGESD